MIVFQILVRATFYSDDQALLAEISSEKRYVGARRLKASIQIIKEAAPILLRESENMKAYSDGGSIGFHYCSAFH